MQHTVILRPAEPKIYSNLPLQDGEGGGTKRTDQVFWNLAMTKGTWYFTSGTFIHLHTISSIRQSVRTISDDHGSQLKGSAKAPDLCTALFRHRLRYDTVSHMNGEFD